MKYGVIPTSLRERLALWTGKMPIPLLDALCSILKARALMAGVRLGVFEALQDGPRLPAEIAATCHLDPECTELLLRALAHAEYVDQVGSRYILSRLGRDTMVTGADTELFGYIQWNYTQWQIMGHLEALLRTGRGIDFHETMADPEEWTHYQRAMLEIARIEAPLVASRVPVKRRARRLLDLAGSHGLFGATICRKYPPMKSVVLDLPNAIEPARVLACEEKIDDVVEHRAGNIHTTEFGTGYDVILLANILHHFKDEENLKVLQRSHGALSPEGTIAIWEIEAPDPNTKPEAGDDAALFFRLTSTARCYRSSEYKSWLTRVGFQHIRVTRPLMLPGTILVVGRRM